MSGILHTIMIDNGQHLEVRQYKLYTKYHIEKIIIHNTMSQQMVSKGFSKTLCSILEKMVDKNKKTRLDKLPEILWADRTTVRAPTQDTPHSFDFGAETVLPLKVQLPSLKSSCCEEITNERKVDLGLVKLETFDEETFMAQQNLELYIDSGCPTHLTNTS